MFGDHGFWLAWDALYLYNTVARDGHCELEKMVHWTLSWADALSRHSIFRMKMSSNFSKDRSYYTFSLPLLDRTDPDHPDLPRLDATHAMTIKERMYTITTKSISAHHSPQNENICQELTQASCRSCGEPNGLCVAAESAEIRKLEEVTGPGRIPED